MDMTGKLVIVTGASSGIGAATAKALHAIGMKVVGFARRKEKIEELIEDHDGRFFALKVDLTNPQDIIEGFAWVSENIGPIDVLINNAGVGSIGATYSISDGDIEAWKKVMDTNFTSALLCCREAIRSMRHNCVDGHIINISSIAGLRVVPIPNCGIYSASKYALCGLTENLRLELAMQKSGIRTTCLNPGVVKTDLQVATGMMTKQESDEFLYNMHPYLSSEDIADSIVYIVKSPKHVQISSMTIQPVGETF